MSQHADLSPERWSTFSLGQQLLMIANEMNRASKLMGAENRERLRNAYERILNLADLTVAVNERTSLRRELLRWRELAAGQYLEPHPAQHRALLRVLLLLTPESAVQAAFVAPYQP